MAKNREPKAADKHLHPRIVFHIDGGWRQAGVSYARSCKPKSTLSEICREAYMEYLQRRGVAPALEAVEARQ